MNQVFMSTNYILPLSNILWRLLYIDLMQISIYKTVFNIQLEYLLIKIHDKREEDANGVETSH